MQLLSNNFEAFGNSIVEKHTGFGYYYDPISLIFLDENQPQESKDSETKRYNTYIQELHYLKQENKIFEQNITFLTNLMEKNVTNKVTMGIENHIRQLIATEVSAKEEKEMNRLVENIYQTIVEMQTSQQAASVIEQNILQQLSGEPLSGEPLSGEPLSGEPLSGEPLSGEPLSGEPLSGEPLSRETRLKIIRNIMNIVNSSPVLEQEKTGIVRDSHLSFANLYPKLSSVQKNTISDGRQDKTTAQLINVKEQNESVKNMTQVLPVSMEQVNLPSDMVYLQENSETKAQQSVIPPNPQQDTKEKQNTVETKRSIETNRKSETKKEEAATKQASMIENKSENKEGKTIPEKQLVSDANLIEHIVFNKDNIHAMTSTNQKRTENIVNNFLTEIQPLMLSTIAAAEVSQNKTTAKPASEKVYLTQEDSSARGQGETKENQQVSIQSDAQPTNSQAAVLEQTRKVEPKEEKRVKNTEDTSNRKMNEQEKMTKHFPAAVVEKQSSQVTKLLSQTIQQLESTTPQSAYLIQNRNRVVKRLENITLQYLNQDITQNQFTSQFTQEISQYRTQDAARNVLRDSKTFQQMIDKNAPEHMLQKQVASVLAAPIEETEKVGAAQLYHNLAQMPDVIRIKPSSKGQPQRVSVLDTIQALTPKTTSFYAPISLVYEESKENAKKEESGRQANKTQGKEPETEHMVHDIEFVKETTKKLSQDNKQIETTLNRNRSRNITEQFTTTDMEYIKNAVTKTIEQYSEENVTQITRQVYRRIEDKLKSERSRRGLI